jgi:DNA (cytosine-5)-methyltransferase 1
MLSVGGENHADVVIGELAEIGYRTGYALLNAVWYGVPQFRERLFFIGIRDDLGRDPSAPATTHSIELPDGYARPLRSVTPLIPFGDLWDRLKGQLPVRSSALEQPAVTVEDSLADLPWLDTHLSGESLPRGDFRQQMPYRSHPATQYARLMRSWPGLPTSHGVVDHAVRRTPRDYETFRRMRPGDRYPEALAIAHAIHAEEVGRLKAAGKAPSPGSPEWEELKEKLVPPYDDTEFPDKWRKLVPDRPSWTVPAHLAKDSYSHIHYDSDQARMISVREAARLQSFPDAFTFAGNMGDCFRQIGNAVPPLLALAVSKSVRMTLDESYGAYVDRD